MASRSPGLYKITVRVEVPVVFRADKVPEGTTWRELEASAAATIERSLFPNVRKVAEIAALTGPGSGGFFPDGTEYDPDIRGGLGRRAIRGLRLRYSRPSTTEVTD